MVYLVGDTFPFRDFPSLIIEVQYLLLMVFTQPLRGTLVPDGTIKRLLGRQLGPVLVRPFFVVTPIILSGPLAVFGLPPGVGMTMLFTILGRPNPSICPRANDAGSRQAISTGGRLIKTVGR